MELRLKLADRMWMQDRIEGFVHSMVREHIKWLSASPEMYRMVAELIDYQEAMIRAVCMAHWIHPCNLNSRSSSLARTGGSC